MKKLVYTLAILFVLATSLSSCTKEEVKPQGGGNSTGGSPSDKGF